MKMKNATSKPQNLEKGIKKYRFFYNDFELKWLNYQFKPSRYNYRPT